MLSETHRWQDTGQEAFELKPEKYWHSWLPTGDALDMPLIEVFFFFFIILKPRVE